jgi:hypothetical protein
MIGMVMGYKDGMNGIKGYVILFENLLDCSDSYASIN